MLRPLNYRPRINRPFKSGVYFFHTMTLLCTIVIVIAGCLHFMPSILLAREEKEILEYRHLLCFFLQTIYHSFWQVQKLNWSCNKRKRQATKKILQRNSILKSCGRPKLEL